MRRVRGMGGVVLKKRSRILFVLGTTVPSPASSSSSSTPPLLSHPLGGISWMPRRTLFGFGGGGKAKAEEPAAAARLGHAPPGTGSDAAAAIDPSTVYEMVPALEPREDARRASEVHKRLERIRAMTTAQERNRGAIEDMFAFVRAHTLRRELYEDCTFPSCFLLFFFFVLINRV